MKKFELRLAVIRTKFSIFAAVVSAVGVVIAAVHLWLFIAYVI